MVPGMPGLRSVRVSLVVCIIPMQVRRDVAHVTGRCLVLRPHPVGRELRDGDGCQDTDDGDDDHQLDQGETFLAVLPLQLSVECS